MTAEDIVDSLMPAGWQDTDSKEAAIAEVETLQNELRDDPLVREIVSNLFEAFKTENDLP